MQRIPRHRLLSALLTFVSLMVVTMLPIGGFVSAASAATNCPNSEGTFCFLAISAPESVATGRVFTVQVAVTTDGSTVARSDPCSKVDVNLLVSDIEAENSVLYVAKTSGGVATFNLIVTNPGPYSLDTTASKPGCSYVSDSAEFMAVDIPADQPIAPCPDNVSCAQTTSTTGSAATLFADTGTFSPPPFFSALVGQGCGDGGPADPNGVLNFAYVGVDSKTIILALRPDRVTKGIGLYNICWRSDLEFTQLGGTPAPVVDGMFTGYLPSCKQNDVGPCVLFKMSGQHNDAFFGILAPPGDPLTYPN
jgi:hypothetical protein